MITPPNLLGSSIRQDVNAGVQQRSQSLDVLKFVLALLIMILHFPENDNPGTFTLYIKPALTRFAVPCFFIISGYFLYGNECRKKAKKALGKLVPITLVASLAYWLLLGCQGFGPYDVVVFTLFNVTDKFGIHLWYMFAYIYALLIIAFMFKPQTWAKLFWLIPILLIAELVMGKYSMVLTNREFPYFICRNWLITGVPYILIGAWLKNTNFRLSNSWLLICIVLFFFMTSIEKYLLVNYGLNAMREAYVSTPILAIAVFLYFKNNPGIKSNLMSYLGRRWSQWIYICHPFIYQILYY